MIARGKGVNGRVTVKKYFWYLHSCKKHSNDQSGQPKKTVYLLLVKKTGNRDVLCLPLTEKVDLVSALRDLHQQRLRQIISISLWEKDFQ